VRTTFLKGERGPGKRKIKKNEVKTGWHTFRKKRRTISGPEKGAPGEHLEPLVNFWTHWEGQHTRGEKLKKKAGGPCVCNLGTLGKQT